MDLADIPELQHPAFPQPADQNATIWRYIDIDKLRFLILNRRLYMARADTLGDDFEGTTPAAESERWRRLIAEAAGAHERATLEANRQMLTENAVAFRDAYYVNCWHTAEDENVAMWDRYVATTSSVAVRTTYSSLREQLEPRQLIYLGLVRYIDYDAQTLPSFNMLQRISHKRHFYRDEREVRAVLCSIAPPEIGARYIEPFITSDRRGFLQPVDAVRLIKGVVLHPKSTSSFMEEVTKLCKQEGLPAPTLSRIASRPGF